MAEKIDVMKQTKQALAALTSGVYVLAGKEEYLKRNFLSDIKKAIFPPDAMAELDTSVYSGADCLEELSDTLDMPPLTSNMRLVLWYDPPVCDRGAEKKLYSLLERAKNGVDCLLVLYLYDEAFDTADIANRTRITKLSSVGQFFDFKTMSAAKLTRWVSRHFAAHGFTVDGHMSDILCEYTDCDMTSLADEIEKLCCYMKESGQTELTEALIEAIVPRRRSFENFYLSDRIGRRDADGVLKYFKAQYEAGCDPILLLASFSSEVEKLARIKFGTKEGLIPETIAKKTGMHEYALKLKLACCSRFKEQELSELLDACYEADIAMKSAGGDKYLILQTLACMLQ